MKSKIWKNDILLPEHGQRMSPGDWIRTIYLDARQWTILPGQWTIFTDARQRTFLPESGPMLIGWRTYLPI